MVGQKCFMFFFQYICLNVEMYLCTLKNVFGPIDCFLQAWVDQLAKCQLRPCPPSQDCVSNPRPIPILTDTLYFALVHLNWHLSPYRVLQTVVGPSLGRPYILEAGDTSFINLQQQNLIFCNSFDKCNISTTIMQTGG